MSKFMKEFREFINRGNVMDMAVGIIIGGAFTAIVNSLIDSIINPLITVITGGEGTNTGWAIPIPGTEQAVDFGAFIGAVINFLITALVVFMLMKAFNRSKELAEAAAKKAAQRTKIKLEEEDKEARHCPYCASEVDDEAKRCPNCTSILPNATKEDIAAMNGTN